jgi:hypothetical protein
MIATLWAGAVPLAALCLMAAVVGWFWTRPAYVVASETWSSYTAGFTAESVLDQSERSVWTPGTLPAYVDIDLRGEHPLHVVRVTNSDDFPQHDVWSDVFVVQLFDGDEEVFMERRPFASPTSVERFDVDAIADRIRVTVETSHGPRGPLADVSWE